MTPTVWRDAVLYESTSDRVVCLLCPFACALADGQSGRCHVRRRTGDRVQTRTYASAVAHLDSIERKPLYHFRPGIKALTLAAPGCMFRCEYCVNHRISQFGRSMGSGPPTSAVDVADVVSTAAKQGACVALSYSEPGLAPELTLALAAAGRECGVDVVWKTNGFLTERAVDLVGPSLAAANVDLKSIDEVAHRRLTGAPVAPVVRTIGRLRERGVWVEVSTPLIPGISGEPAALQVIAATIAAIDPGIPWHLLRFTPAYRMSDSDPTLPDALDRAQHIGWETGLRYVYVERALGAPGRATYCPGCGTVLVERDVWGLASSRLSGGRCPDCGRHAEGRW